MVGDRQQQRDGGHRADTGQHAHEHANKHTERDEAQIGQAESGLEPKSKVGKRLQDGIEERTHQNLHWTNGICKASR